MKKLSFVRANVWAVMLVIALAVIGPALAGPEQDKLRQLVTLSGQRHDGATGGRGDLFGTGDHYECWNWAKGPEITGDWEGTIRIPFDGLIRHKHYIAQVESGTSDSNPGGAVICNYSISRSNKLYLTDIRYDGDQPRTLGNSLLEHLRSINGTNLN